MARAKIEISQSNASFRTSWNTQKFNKRETDKRHTEMNIKVIKNKYKKISTYNKHFRKKMLFIIFFFVTNSWSAWSRTMDMTTVRQTKNNLDQ